MQSLRGFPDSAGDRRLRAGAWAVSGSGGEGRGGEWHEGGTARIRDASVLCKSSGRERGGKRGEKTQGVRDEI